MLATKEKSHPGFQLPTAALHPAFGFAISNTATEFDDPLYDFRGGPRCSGYFRDAETSLDYAVNRYHQPGVGRFMSPDPYNASVGPADPGSWNRYAYTRGDPVNRKDTFGLVDCCQWEPGDPIPGPINGGGTYGNNSCASQKVPEPDCNPDSGGGGSDSINHVTKLSTTSAKAVAVQNDLRWLQQAILQDPTCSKWLTNGVVDSTTAINLALGVPGSGTTAMGVGVGSFSDATANAVAGTAGTDLPPGMLITINLNGAFFNSGPSSFVGYGVPAWITGNSPAAQALILIHELAHNIIGDPGFQDDGGDDPTAQANNNKKVLDNCGSVINLVAGRN